MLALPEGSDYALFLGASLVVLLIPGPAVLYIVTRSIDGGWRAGVVSALGAGVGNLAHVAAAVAGISSLVANSALAFTAVKWAGAIYLLWLGAARLLRRDSDLPDERPLPAPAGVLFRQAVMVNVLNPKVALFFLAFLPQFVDPVRGVVWQQILVLGISFVLLGIVTDSLYGSAAGVIGETLRRGSRARRAERYVAGGTLIALGMASAATGSPDP